jgi:hypothetical protein
MDTGEAWAVKLRDQRDIGGFRHWKDHDGYTGSFQRVCAISSVSPRMRLRRNHDACLWF